MKFNKSWKWKSLIGVDKEKVPVINEARQVEGPSESKAIDIR